MGVYMGSVGHLRAKGLNFKDMCARGIGWEIYIPWNKEGLRLDLKI